MGWLKKLFGNVNEDDSHRGKSERLVMTYLEAARHLALCGDFNEKHFDKVEQILSKHEWYQSKPERSSEIKASVPNLIITDTGLSGWDHVKVREHESLSEAVSSFLKTIREEYPDSRTEAFIKKVIIEMDEIARLISK